MKRNSYTNHRSQGLREQILQIAGECVDQHGLRGTTILRVAEMVGVSRQTVHSYFSTKEILVGEVILDYELNGIKQTLGKIDLSKPARTVVEGAIRGMIKHMQQPRGRKLMAKADRDIAAKAAATHDLVSVYATKLWFPILTRLNEDGHIRPGVDFIDAGKWLFLIYFGILQNEWLNPKEMHRLIESFVAPSILRE